MIFSPIFSAADVSSIPPTTLGIISGLVILAIVLANVISKLAGIALDRLVMKNRPSLLETKMTSMCESMSRMSGAIAVMADQVGGVSTRTERIDQQTGELHNAHLGASAIDAEGRPKWWVPPGLVKKIDSLDERLVELSQSLQKG